MNARKKLNRLSKNTKHGIVLILMVFIIPMLLIVAGFAINLSYMELARTDLQIASDSASRAACRTFGYTSNINAARSAAKKAATNNPVMGKVLTLHDKDIIFGTSSRPSPGSKYLFTPSSKKINSVNIDFQSAASGSIQLPIRIGVSNPNFAVAQRAIATQADVDIVLVVDRSGSMAYAVDEISSPTVLPKKAPKGWDFNGPVPPYARWTDAMDAIDIFLNDLSSGSQNATVGLATYSHYSTIDLNLTSNFADVSQVLKTYSNPFNAGGTNIGDGIYSGLTNILYSPNRRSEAVPVMILLTDGIQNWGPSPTDAAYEAADTDVIIYTITFSDEAAQAPMIEIANIGKGKHYHAKDANTLQNAFKEIAGDLPVLLTQ